MNKKSKGINGLGIGIILLVLILIIVAAIYYFQTGKIIGAALFHQSPARAGVLASDIIDYRIPEGYEEQLLDTDVLRQVSISEYGASDFQKSGMLIILTIIPPNGTLEDETEGKDALASLMDTRASMLFAMRETQHGETTIDGQLVPLNTYWGRGENIVELKEIVTGLIPGKQDNVMLTIISADKNWDQDFVDTFINSIHK